MSKAKRRNSSKSNNSDRELRIKYSSMQGMFKTAAALQ